jgi:hypothetical protein
MSNPIPRRLASLGAVIGLTMLLVGCSLWSTSPPRRGWPVEVSPDLSGDTGTVVVSGEEDFGFNGGLEGNQPFVRATDASGGIVPDQHFAWPGVEQRLPVGSYVVRVYARSCDGFCDYLSPEGLHGRCDVELHVAADARHVIDVAYSNTSMQCTLA